MCVCVCVCVCVIFVAWISRDLTTHYVTKSLDYKYGWLATFFHVSVWLLCAQQKTWNSKLYVFYVLYLSSYNSIELFFYEKKLFSILHFI